MALRRGAFVYASLREDFGRVEYNLGNGSCVVQFEGESLLCSERTLHLVEDAQPRQRTAWDLLDDPIFG